MVSSFFYPLATGAKIGYNKKKHFRSLFMNRFLGFSWAGLFALCAWLGTVQTTNVVARVALSVIAVLFFVPGALLLYNGLAEKKRGLVLAVRYISLASLVLTTFSFVLTITLVGKAAAAFIFSYYVLRLISSPLFCGRYVWWLILFLWAFLLIASFSKKPQTRK